MMIILEFFLFCSTMAHDFGNMKNGVYFYTEFETVLSDEY